MGAPKGNQFWKARTTHGRDKIFSTPEILWDAACEYFQWVEDNPLFEDKVNFFQGQPVHDTVEKMRAMTISGLCLFLGVAESTFHSYGSQNDFMEVLERIRKTVYNQKFTGAAADLLNSNIIARDLGLKDKAELDHRSGDGSMSTSFDADKYKAAQDKLSSKLD